MRYIFSKIVTHFLLVTHFKDSAKFLNNRLN